MDSVNYTTYKEEDGVTSQRQRAQNTWLLLSAIRTGTIFTKYYKYVKKNEVSGWTRLRTNYPLKMHLTFKWESLIFMF